MKIKKNLFLILGNGFTIDLLTQLEKSNIDTINLFSKGDTVVWPDGSNECGFLSYKHCPSLWNLGAKPYMNNDEAIELIEDIITCANMVASSNVVMQESNIYLDAYYELVAYLKHLFIQYNKQVDDAELTSSKIRSWGWYDLIQKAYDSSEYQKIIIITYNYDIFLERILKLNHLNFTIQGLEDTNHKIILIKPHGSISFSHRNKNENSTFAIRKTKDMYESTLDDFHVSYENLSDNYLINALIPPAGDSSRLIYKWADQLRELVKKQVSCIEENDKVIISGLSYWHVDRKEIDEILTFLAPKSPATYMVNPHPPRALNAVLTCVLPNHIIYTSSEFLGGIINEL